MRKKLTWMLTPFLVLLISFSYAQEKTISGNVTDQDGLALPGVSIVVVGTTNGTQTDFDGNYAISVAEGGVLQFSYIGQKTEQRTVGAQNTINVQLAQDAEALEEVVVVGYGTKTRDELTSAVSTVTSDEISSFVGTTSVDNILQGKAAGVQVTAQNGRPGNTAFVRIRGNGTFNGDSSPLYVVDGIPVDASNVGAISPNDIENVSILKDAATASRYGSRASNGVVLITTKKGKPGPAKISYKTSFGFSERLKDNFDIFDAEGKLNYERELADLGVAPAQGLPGNVATPEERAFLIANQVNHEDELLEKGRIVTNNLSVSGGADNFSYFLSLGHSEDTGIVDNLAAFERITARLNTTFQAKDWLSIGVNSSVTKSSNAVPRDRNNVQNPIRAIYDYNAYQPIFVLDDVGNFVLDDAGERVYSQNFPLPFNIAEAIVNNPEKTGNLQFIASISADINITKNLTNKFQVGISNDRFNRQITIKPNSRLDQFVRTPGLFGQSTVNGNNDFEYNVSNVLAYDKDFGLSKVSASFLLEYNENDFTSFVLTGEGFPTDQLDVLSITSTPTTASTDRFKNTLFSQAVFADYNFDDRYIVSGSIRRDGSSRFGPENRYGYFGSGAVAWNIHNEGFLKDNDFLNTLKFRASYGTSGNQNINNFIFAELLDFGSTNGRSTVTPNGIGNPAIQWESQGLLDVGLEFGFLNNRVRGVVDYFEKTSKDLLSNFNISSTVGDENNAILSNIGEIENTGVEFEISADIIRNNNFRWTVGGNVAFIDSEVNELVGGVDQFRNFTLLREGEEVNTFFLVRYAGVDPQTGAPQYLDVDGNITNTFSGDDAVALEGKSPQANIEGGFSTNLSYKGLDLAANFTFKAGNYIYNGIEQTLLSDGNGVNRNQRTDAVNFWRTPGDTDVLPSPLFRNDANQTSDRFLQKGDFVRLRNLTLGYSVPNNLFKKIPINRLRVYLQGQNLWTYNPHFKGDPEVGIGSGESGGFQTAGQRSQFSYPSVRSFNFGLEIDF